MAREWKDLGISAEVPSSTTSSNVYVVPNGVEVEIAYFEGHAVYTVNSVVKAVWDMSGTPENIWSTKGDAQSRIYKVYTGDGVKKLAICLENGEDGAVVMSGEIKFLERT